jgi:hypothetical protein
MRLLLHQQRQLLSLLDVHRLAWLLRRCQRLLLLLVGLLAGPE